MTRLGGFVRYYRNSIRPDSRHLVCYFFFCAGQN